MRTMKTDFVVIGGGGAGLSAALTAHENGVSNIVVLEKSPFWGGNSRMAGGQIFAVETPDQYENGTVITRDSVFQETMQFHHYSLIQPKILRKFLDNGAETIAWLESLGFDYFNHDGTNYMKAGLKPFGNFKMVTDKMVQELKNGGHTLLKNANVIGLTRNNDDSWTITAETTEGEIPIHAKAVAITTGGFTGNNALMQKYFSGQYQNNYYFDGIPMDGDGISLAKQAGADLAEQCTLIKEICHSCDSNHDTPSIAAQQPACLWVNAYGERFHDESRVRLSEYANAVTRQPGNMGYALFDGNIFEFARTYHDSTFMPLSVLEGDGHQKPPMELPDLEQQMIREAQRSDKWVFVSSDWDGISKWIGADASVLRATVDEYNADCDAHHDRIFAKDAEFLIPLRKPPFYAIRFQPMLIDTAGPIVIDASAQVLAPDHKAIPGLYSAGVITSGWQGADYHLHGCALGYAVTFGRLAGKTATKYLRSHC